MLLQLESESIPLWFRKAVECSISENGSIGLLVHLFKDLVALKNAGPKDDGGTTNLESLVRSMICSNSPSSAPSRLLLQRILRVGYVSTMAHFNSDAKSAPSRGDQFEFDPLLRLG